METQKYVIIFATNIIPYRSRTHLPNSAAAAHSSAAGCNPHCKLYSNCDTDVSAVMPRVSGGRLPQAFLHARDTSPKNKKPFPMNPARPVKTSAFFHILCSIPQHSFCERYVTCYGAAAVHRRIGETFDGKTGIRICAINRPVLLEVSDSKLRFGVGPKYIQR